MTGERRDGLAGRRFPQPHSAVVRTGQYDVAAARLLANVKRKGVAAVMRTSTSRARPILMSKMFGGEGVFFAQLSVRARCGCGVCRSPD